MLEASSSVGVYASVACFHNCMISFVQPTGKSDTGAGIPVLGQIKTICNKSLFAVTLEFEFQLLLHLSSVFILINFHSFFYSVSFSFCLLRGLFSVLGNLTLTLLGTASPSLISERSRFDACAVSLGERSVFNVISKKNQHCC